MSKVLVTGGGGSIGSELVRQLSASYHEVYVLDTNETACFDLIEELRLKGLEVSGRVGDVTCERTIDEVFEAFKPEVVFHAAARKHVTPSNWFPKEVIEINTLGTYNIIRACKKYKAKLVNISTDKVIHANSIMGATKKVAEIMVKNAGFVSVRFGNVLGSRGSVIPIWQQQVDRGESITVTHPDMERYFMTIPQACELVIKAHKIGKPGQILILDMGKPIKILDLAKQIIQGSGKNIPIKIIGIRPGETMNEKLMTDEEEKLSTRRGKFWVLY